MDELAEAKERLAQIDQVLGRTVTSFQIDKADDVAQTENIEQLRALKDQECATIERLQRQMKAVQEGRLFDNEARRPLEVGL